jgi:hypothetical protein
VEGANEAELALTKPGGRSTEDVIKFLLNCMIQCWRERECISAIDFRPEASGMHEGS